MSCNVGEKHFSRIPDTGLVELLTGKEKWANLLRSLGETKAKKYYLVLRASKEYARSSTIRLASQSPSLNR